MANALHIDTLKFARKLTDAGMDQKAAEAIAEGLAEADTSTLATKQDLAEFKAELFRHLWIMAAGIVGLTVTLIKVLPG
ncbi:MULTISPECIES: hypothetical protein [Paracoccus]|jgi:hypothetical protein|uniref:DUF1640 domain-containing protein n=1 Tax=Paracoccus kondratievae TaxID=135740 RepID=A0A0G3B6F1_9RHOB|nr:MULTISPECIES: hypothetical protein [Paracoccus]AKJ20422.1 hypothetical protein pKON1_p28 [Paracoccus kondratievae]GLK65230.1 hypothetical protein GCM10017635_27040 [Paracoccus kondratievae]